MSSFNPLINPHFLKLFYDPLKAAYGLEIDHNLGNIRLTLGKASTAAAFMQANDVKFFDYDQMNLEDEPLTEFIKACAAIHFEI